MSDYEKWRRYQRMARNIAKLVTIIDDLDFVWASHDCVCEECGLAYIEHPAVVDEFLHLGCDGKLLKL